MNVSWEYEKCPNGWSPPMIKRATVGNLLVEVQEDGKKSLATFFLADHELTEVSVPTKHLDHVVEAFLIMYEHLKMVPLGEFYGSNRL